MHPQPRLGTGSSCPFSGKHRSYKSCPGSLLACPHVPMAGSPKDPAQCWVRIKLHARHALLAHAYLLGPRWFLTGIYPFFVMVEWFLLCWSLVLPLLLLLLLQGHQVVPLLLELPLQPLCLPLLLQLLALILLPRGKHSDMGARCPAST